MATELHTFVVPAYGDSPYLEECLVTLRAQSVRSRVLLCTSTPSPFIDAAAERFAAPVLVNPRREGMAQDWTFAYRTAETPYVTLAHQDDCYLPDYTATLLHASSAPATPSSDSATTPRSSAVSSEHIGSTSGSSGRCCAGHSCSRPLCAPRSASDSPWPWAARSVARR